MSNLATTLVHAMLQRTLKNYVLSTLFFSDFKFGTKSTHFQKNFQSALPQCHISGTYEYCAVASMQNSFSYNNVTITVTCNSVTLTKNCMCTVLLQCFITYMLQ